MRALRPLPLPHSLAPCASRSQARDELMTLPGCGHSFHAPCISRWLRDFGNTCPIDGGEVQAAS